ncbi:hypothetical protein [Streptomyces sp. NE5-10]|uniref:hypothetical protein n=1 Tax=Streptomyces sp. NE5-10 TaxID=2759674 RepID=UPI0019074B37|nr:hypothetical protein [Streptomyces sp. NE5-10]
MRAVAAVTGLGLWRSKALLGNTPATVLEDSSLGAVVAVARRLRDSGVPAVVRCTACDRTVPPDETPLAPGPCASPFWPTAHCQANSLATCDYDFCGTYGPLCLTP